MNELKIVQFIGLYADCEWAADSGRKKVYFTLYVGAIDYFNKDCLR